MPFFQTVIGWDGEVRICCHDALNKIKIGNIKNEGLLDILESKIAKKYRNDILLNRKEIYPCNICNC